MSLDTKINRMCAYITSTALAYGAALYRSYDAGLIGDVEYYQSGLALEDGIRTKAIVKYLSGDFDER